MATNKKSTNPLLGPAVSGFSLSQSFGAQAAVLVPTASPAPSSLTAGQPFTSSPADGARIGPPPSISPMGPPPLKPPPAGVFLLPPQGGASLSSPSTSGQPLGPPPSSPFLAGNFSTVTQASKRSPYVPPPGNFNFSFAFLSHLFF